MFDLSVTKLLVLAVLALVIFGPDQLPKMAGQLGRAVRDLRRMAEQARADLTEVLGPEFTDSSLADLNPRTLLRKHLLDDPGGHDATDAQARPHPMPPGDGGPQ